jgi:CRISPR system Cascade subunit CasE
MKGPLYMFELRPDPMELIRFSENHGLNRRYDEDLGYSMHAWLAAAFGKLAPKPFRLIISARGRRPPRVLGYSDHSKDDLLNYLQTYAEPSAFAVCPPSSIAVKPMPTTWATGRTYRFELLSCPISRKDGSEKDVYLRRLDKEGPAAKLNRESVYRDWLTRQLSGTADLAETHLNAFRLVHFYRRGESGKLSKSLLPQALFTGVLVVANGDAFARILARGIGRHRAFGYGMLLLRST